MYSVVHPRGCYRMRMRRGRRYVPMPRRFGNASGLRLIYLRQILVWGLLDSVDSADLTSIGQSASDMFITL
jgi:hypothetical protein